MNEQSYYQQGAGACPSPAVIESASASTACQTSPSRFAYIVTASVLGIVALLALAFIMLIFTAASTGLEAGFYSIHSSSDIFEQEDDGFNYDVWGTQRTEWDGGCPSGHHASGHHACRR